MSATSSLNFRGRVGIRMRKLRPTALRLPSMNDNGTLLDEGVFSL